MAKKTTSKTKTETAARIQRTEAYANQVRALFVMTVNQILALNKTVPQLEPGVMFSFDAQSLKMQKEVERLLRQLHSVATMAIQNGIKLEWGQANLAADQLVKSIIGKELFSNPTFNAWTARNEAAMQKFINRSERGLNLSDRVWKSVRQLRDEMEVAITVAVGEGKSAQKMSQDVRKYLNDPDLMFRRFRYKKAQEIQYDENGNEIGKKIIWGKKWKKRIKKPDGTYGWIDYDRDSYKTGAGVYKSSAKNAMRVARTETNIAYRRADNERWNQMDFVLGQRINLSGDHPAKDICDKLAGDYPKEFLFDGWHPQCFCYVTPITLPPEETAHLTEMMLKGEDWRAELAKLKRGREITQYPNNFKTWVRDNEEKIDKATKRGTLPYFISNNRKAINAILNPDSKDAQEQLQKEEQQRIEQAQRQAELEVQKKEAHLGQITLKYGDKVLEIMKDIPGVDTTALQAAIKAGDTSLIQQEAAKLRDIGKQFKIDAKTALNSAAQYGEISGSELEAAIQAGSIKDIWEKTKALQTTIADTQADEAALSQLIPNAHEWHKQFSSADLHVVYDNVEKKLNSLSTLPLDIQIKKLKDEVKYVVDSTYLKPHTLYPTAKVAEAAYTKALLKAQHQQKVEELKNKLEPLKIYALQHPKATALQNLIQQAEISLLSDDLLTADGYICQATKKKESLEKAQAKRDAKKGTSKSITFNDDDFTQERKDNATWYIDRHDAHEGMFNNAVETWKLATEAEKKAVTRYTEGSAYITEPLRGIEGYYHYYTSRMNQSKEDIDAMTNYIARSTFPTDMWVKRDERAAFLTYRLGINVTEICDNERMKHDLAEEIKLLQAKDLSGFTTAYKKTHNDKIIQLQKELAEIKTSPTQLLGKTGIDESFLSCGSCKNTKFSGTSGDNIYRKPRVMLNIYCPKGTMMTYADAFNHYTTGYSAGNLWDGITKKSPGECEVFIQRGSKMRVMKVEYNYDLDILYVDVDILSQRMPNYELQNFPSKGGYKAIFK